MRKGFSLIEMIIYIAILGVVMVTIVSFMSVIMNTKAKAQAISEVEQQGLQLMQTIDQTVHNATAINSPTVGNSSGLTLSLALADEAVNPTLFTLSGTTLQMKEGAGSYIDLNSSKVKVTNISFTNISRTSTRGIIKIQFTLAYNNSSNTTNFNYSKTFYSSAAIR